MIENRNQLDFSKLWKGLYVSLFLIVFLNFSVVIQYINFDDVGIALIELCEEEGEEEVELDEIEYDFHTTQISPNTPTVDNNSNLRNSSVQLDFYIEVFTPPPELS